MHMRVGAGQRERERILIRLRAQHGADPGLISTTEIMI